MDRYSPGLHASVGLIVGTVVGYGVGYEVVGAGVGMAKQLPEWPFRPFVHWPAGQATHIAYSSVLWYLPEGQCKQVIWPVQALYWPEAHDSQEAPED